PSDDFIKIRPTAYRVVRTLSTMERSRKREVSMRRAIFAVASLFAATLGAQQQAGFAESPYHVLTRARVGGEGGWDYITADPAGRRLYIPRGMVRAAAATDSTPAREAVAPRIAV